MLLLGVNDDKAWNLDRRVLVDSGKWIFTNWMASVEHVNRAVYVSILTIKSDTRLGVTPRSWHEGGIFSHCLSYLCEPWTALKDQDYYV